MRGTSSRIALVLGALCLFACGDAAGERAESIESLPSALPVGTGGGNPPPLPPPAKDAGAPDVGGPVVFTPGPVIAVPRTCSSVYVEAHRPGRTCGDILPTSAKAGGAWTAINLFPDAEDPTVNDHFCGYTWLPTGTLGCPVAMEALELSGYQPGETHGFPEYRSSRSQPRPLDSWIVRTDCAGPTACAVGASKATERASIDQSHGARQGGGATSLVMRPGGGCETCGVVLDNHAFVVNPGDQAAGVLVFNVHAGTTLHQVSVPTPGTRVFSVELPALPVPYTNEPILETWFLGQ